MSSDVVLAAEQKAFANVATESPAIVVAGLGKRYEIYDRPHQRLLQTILRGRRTFYREFWALADVTLAIRRGETLGLIGRNGSGKSTLLQLVAGTLTPTTGIVRTTGRVAALLELGSGFNPEFTGRENVYLNGAILGIPRHEMDQAIAAIEEFADIGDFIDQPVKMYSSGMMVRLAFAVAVHVTPDVLIIDEALAVGDTAFQSKCLERIRKMQRAGVAILLVSHAPNTIIEFCDRAAYIDRGRLVAVGNCRAIIERYTNDLISSYGGTTLPPVGARDLRTEGEMSESIPTAVVPRSIGPPPATEIVAVTIADARGVPKQAFANGETVRVQFDVVFHEANPAPCFGIQIKSPDDIVLWTCTTQMMDLSLPERPAGTRERFEWRLDANFGGGRYVFALGTGDVSSGQYLPHSRMHYAGHLDVVPEPRRGSGFLEPAARFASHVGEMSS
jgi:lipopolysaccharide transport system ATP-binding protein